MNSVSLVNPQQFAGLEHKTASQKPLLHSTSKDSFALSTPIRFGASYNKNYSSKLGLYYDHNYYVGEPWENLRGIWRPKDRKLASLITAVENKIGRKDLPYKIVVARWDDSQHKGDATYQVIPLWGNHVNTFDNNPDGFLDNYFRTGQQTGRLTSLYTVAASKNYRAENNISPSQGSNNSAEGRVMLSFKTDVEKINIDHSSIQKGIEFITDTLQASIREKYREDRPFKIFHIAKYDDNSADKIIHHFVGLEGQAAADYEEYPKGLIRNLKGDGLVQGYPYPLDQYHPGDSDEEGYHFRPKTKYLEDGTVSTSYEQEDIEIRDQKGEKIDNPNTRKKEGKAVLTGVELLLQQAMQNMHEQSMADKDIISQQSSQSHQEHTNMLNFVALTNKQNKEERENMLALTSGDVDTLVDGLEKLRKLKEQGGVLPPAIAAGSGKNLAIIPTASLEEKLDKMGDNAKGEINKALKAGQKKDLGNALGNTEDVDFEEVE